MPLYKFPVVSLITIFLPLWLISIISLGNFFIGNVIVIAGRMIAFAALLPTIRGQLPQSPSITFVELLIYFEATMTSLLSLIQIVRIQFDTEFPFSYVWHQDAILICSICVTSLTIITVLILTAIHKFIWEPSYNLPPHKENPQLKHWTWYNMKCDKHFSRYQGLQVHTKRDSISTVYDEEFETRSHRSNRKSG